MEAFFLIIVGCTRTESIAITALTLAVGFSGFAISGKLSLLAIYLPFLTLNTNRIYLFQRFQCQSLRYSSSLCQYSDGYFKRIRYNCRYAMSNCDQ